MRRINGLKVRRNSFLELALQVNNWNLKQTKKKLEEEYLNVGAAKMAERWGFHYQTIYSTLKKLKIKLLPKGWGGVKARFHNALMKYGSVDIAMHKFEHLEVTEIASKLGFSPSYVELRLQELGYRRSKKEGRWIKVCQK